MSVLVRNIIIIAFITLLTRCEKQVELDVEFTKRPILVVDAIITNEIKRHEIVLSRLNESPNNEAMYVSGALVQLHFNDTVIHFSESDSLSGRYYSDRPFGAATNFNYTLQIQHKNREFLARARVAPLYSRDSLKIRPADTLGNYYIVPPNEFNPVEAAMYEITIDDPNTDSPIDSRFYYYTLTSIDISQIFTSTQQQITFKKGVRVMQTKYGLSRQHEEFVRTMLLETRWRGNAFDVESTNVYTNLSSGAVGIFALSTVFEVTHDF